MTWTTVLNFWVFATVRSCMKSTVACENWTPPTRANWLLLSGVKWSHAVNVGPMWAMSLARLEHRRLQTGDFDDAGRIPHSQSLVRVRLNQHRQRLGKGPRVSLGRGPHLCRHSMVRKSFRSPGRPLRVSAGEPLAGVKNETSQIHSAAKAIAVREHGCAPTSSASGLSRDANAEQTEPNPGM
jgi:hypothetical protein